MAATVESTPLEASGVCGVSPNCGTKGGLFPSGVTIREKDPRQTRDRYEWLVVDKPVTWRGRFGDANVRVTVPVGFETDLASVPRFMTWLFPRYGQYTRAAVVHDFLCQQGRDLGAQECPTCVAGVEVLRLKDRSDGDAVFRSMMKTVAVPWARRWLMWSAVSWATVATALRATLKKPATPELRAGWRRRLKPGVFLVIVAAALIVADVAVARVGWPWWLRAVVIGVGSFAAAAEATMIAGCMALRRWRDRLVVYSGAAVFTTLSLGLLVTGLLVAVVLAVYLAIEDFPRFHGFRAYFGRAKPSSPRQRRIDTTTAQLTASRAGGAGVVRP